VSVPSTEEKHTKCLEFGMIENSSHQCLRYSPALELWNNENVHQVREHSAIRDDPRKCDLPPRQIDTEAQRILDRSFHDAALPPLRPVRVTQKPMDDLDVETRGIS
jgi:hypothetical protein